MKKLILTLTACCLAFTQAHAATTILVESLLEYDAIINAIGGVDPNLANVIPSTESITDVRRLTNDVNIYGTVRYKITTRVPNVQEEPLIERELVVCPCHQKSHNYNAELFVEPNPGIGPNIVSVISITPSHH